MISKTQRGCGVKMKPKRRTPAEKAFDEYMMERTGHLPTDKRHIAQLVDGVMDRGPFMSGYRAGLKAGKGRKA